MGYQKAVLLIYIIDVADVVVSKVLKFAFVDDTKLIGMEANQQNVEAAKRFEEFMLLV